MIYIRIKAFLGWMQSMNVTDTFTMSTNETTTTTTTITTTTRLTTVSRTTTSTQRATTAAKNASHRSQLCFCLLLVAVLVNLEKDRIE